jgi:hypothetical protein
MADKDMESSTGKMKAEAANGCGEHCDGHHHSNDG